MSPSLDDLLDQAGKKADSDLSDKISALTGLSEKELKELIPQNTDTKKIEELIKIVSDSTKSNLEKADAINNISGLPEIVLPIIAKLTL